MLSDTLSQHSTSIGALPWYWAQWESQLAATGYKRHPHALAAFTKDTHTWAFLTFEDLDRARTTLTSQNKPLTDLPDLLDLATPGITGFFVNFFPDELLWTDWKQLYPYSKHFVFLPPLPQPLSHAGDKKSKSAFITDSPASSIYPPTPESFAKDYALHDYRPANIPAGCFHKVFDFISAQRHQDLNLALLAPSWIVQSTSPHIQQALCMLAQMHGMKVSFWQKTYSSPLRHLTGEETAFDWTTDTSLRQRWMRTSQSSATVPPTPHFLQLNDVITRLSYPKLKLSNELIELEFHTPKLDAQHLLPLQLINHFQFSPTFPSLLTAAEVIPQTTSGPSSALLSRLWRAILTRIFLAGPTPARRHWYYAFCHHREPTLNATIDIIAFSISQRTPDYEIIKTVLQSAIYYRIPAAQINSLLELLKNSQSVWARIDAHWEAEITGMIDILQGRPPSVSSLSLQCIHAIYTLQPSGGATVTLPNDLSADSLSDFAWRFTLQGLFAAANPFFEQFIALTVNKQNLFTAFCVCNELHSFHSGDPQWRQQHSQVIQQLLVLAERLEVPAAEVQLMKLCFRATVEDSSVGVISEYQTSRAHLGAAAGVFLATIYFQKLDASAAVSILNISGEEKLDDWLTSVAAMLFISSGNRDKGLSLLTELKNQNPCGLRFSFLSPQAPFVFFVIGALGRITGDSQLTQLALGKLTAPALADHVSALQHIPSPSEPRPLPADITQWLLLSL